MYATTHDHTKYYANCQVARSKSSKIPKALVAVAVTSERANLRQNRNREKRLSKPTANAALNQRVAAKRFN